MSKSKKAKDFFTGFIPVVFIWLAGILFSGKIFGGDIYDFGSGVPAFSLILPVLLSAVFILMCLYAKKYDKKLLFVGLLTAFLIPVAAYPVCSIFISLACFSSIFGAVGAVFMFIQMPLTSVYAGFTDASEKYFNADMTISAIIISVFLGLSLITGIILYYCSKKKN